MYQRFKHSAVLALGVGTFAYICHKKHPNYTVFAAVNQNGKTLSNEPGLPQDRPTLTAQNEPSQLRLQQVQIMFRHGARTPLHLIPKIPEANYDSRIIMKEHPASSFPTERVIYGTGEPAEWSAYEMKLRQNPLKDGVSLGALTAYGRDQVYMLGRRLQSSYRERLNIATYNPQEVLVLSSNIKRTVESAKCVLAGFFSKEELQNFAETHSPVKIYVANRKYNILVPDTNNCAVLQKVNHAGIMHSDFIPGFKSDRLAIEKDINDAYDKKIQPVREIQARIDKICGSSGIYGCYKGPSHQLNEHQQTYQMDSVLQPLIKERGQAIENVERLWINAMARHPHLTNIITENDMKALIYLRRLEVERMSGKFCPGYVFHFYFDPNPFFANTHLCKKVYIRNTPGAVPSWSEQIIWKKFGKTIQKEIAERKTDCKCPVEEEAKKSTQRNEKENPKKPCTCGCSEMSFFQWYLTPTSSESDHIWKTLVDDIWTNPIKYLEGKSKYPDKWERTLNFVFVRDDLIARVAHGLSYPTELKKHENTINERATTMLFYAMAGQHEAERAIVPRLSAGPLLTAMVMESEKVVNGKSDSYKLCLYSSHDSTMSALLELLGIWDNQWPPFAADIRLELYQDIESLENFVRVLYCGKVQKILGQKEDMLPWSDFMRVIKKQMIHENEYKSICASDILERVAKDLLQHEEGEVIRPSETPAGM